VMQPGLRTDNVSVVPPTTGQALASDGRSESSASPPDDVGDGHTPSAGDGVIGSCGDDRGPVCVGRPNLPMTSADDIASGEDDVAERAAPNVETSEQQEEGESDEQELEVRPPRRSERDRKAPDRYQAGVSCVTPVTHQDDVRERLDAFSEFLQRGNVKMDSRDIADVIAKLLSTNK